MKSLPVWETSKKPRSSALTASTEVPTSSRSSRLASRLRACIVKVLLFPLRLSMAMSIAMDAVLDYPCPWYEKLFVFIIFVLSAPVCLIWYYVAFRESIES